MNAFVKPVEWTLRWPLGEVTVQALGGMVAPLTFHLKDGRSVSPLQIAPWGEENDSQWPGVLRRLRGEWPCLPYGTSKPPANLPAGWTGHAAEDSWDHGFTANNDWYLVRQTDTEIVVAIDYPAAGPIERLQRTVRVRPDQAAIDVELVIHARQDAQVPLALHPTFKVPAAGLRITSAQAEHVHSYPVPTEPGVSRLLPGAIGPSLDAMPTSDGGVQSYTALPLPYATEELMQMEKCKTPFTLHYPEDKADVQLSWDTAVLPDVLIWISNAGRAHAPWSSRHYALGVEPMSGFFDLGRVVTPTPDHPLAANKGVQLRADKPLTVSYSISAS